MNNFNFFKPDLMRKLNNLWGDIDYLFQEGIVLTDSDKKILKNFIKYINGVLKYEKLLKIIENA